MFTKKENNILIGKKNEELLIIPKKLNSKNNISDIIIENLYHILNSSLDGDEIDFIYTGLNMNDYLVDDEGDYVEYEEVEEETTPSEDTDSYLVEQ